MPYGFMTSSGTNYDGFTADRSGDDAELVAGQAEPFSKKKLLEISVGTLGTNASPA